VTTEIGEPASAKSWPAPWLVALAAIGATLLLVVAINRWATPSDEHAYWLAAQHLAAGQPLYDPSAEPGTPYAYWYPPPIAQALAPLTPFISSAAFTAAWTVMLLACLVFLGNRRVLVSLALVAYLPVAVELWFRNVHLLLAVLIVLALRRSPLFWVPAAAIKVTPVLGIPFLLAARRYREAALAVVVGGVVLMISLALSPDVWRQFLDVVVSKGGTSGSSLVPVPFPVRFGLALVLAVVAGRLGNRRGEVLLVAALTIGNPTLWMTALSLLVAIVPLWSQAVPQATRTTGLLSPIRARRM